MNAKKKIAYWGNGLIGKKLMRIYQKPDLIIDSAPQYNVYDHIAVVKPDEVKNYSEYFIIITVANADGIIFILQKRGLKHGDDFCKYTEYFETYDCGMKESLKDINDLIKDDKSLVGRVIIGAPFFARRWSDDCFHFFNQYISMRDANAFLALNYDTMIPEEIIEHTMGCKTINISGGSVFCFSDLDKNEKYRDIEAELDETEKKWVEYVEQSKNNPDNKKAYEASSQIYMYFKKIFESLKPRGIIWWGGWERSSFIVGHIAGQRNIPIRFAEYGWIPGTFQFDPEGIAGRSRFCDKMYLSNVKYSLSDIDRIFCYITKNQMDSYKPTSNDSEDRDKLKRLTKERPCILLVGMADVGMDINPRSDFYQSYISGVCDSSEEAYYYIKEICERNGWNFIFKPHPAERTSKMKLSVIETNNSIKIENIPIDELIKQVDVVVSITSAVDYKVLMYQKPLVQIGKNSLNAADCTYIVNDKKELEEKLDKAFRMKMTVLQKQNFQIHMAKLLAKLLWDDLTEREVRYGKKVTENII